MINVIDFSKSNENLKSIPLYVKDNTKQFLQMLYLFINENKLLCRSKMLDFIRLYSHFIFIRYFIIIFIWCFIIILWADTEKTISKRVLKRSPIE